MKTIVRHPFAAGLLVVLVAATLAACGQPKPREVIELKLDDKPVELKAEALRQLHGHMRALCDLAEFMGSQVRARSSVGGQAGQATVTAEISPAAVAMGDRRAGVSMQESTELSGGTMQVSTQTSINLDASLPEKLRSYGELAGKQVDTEVFNKVLAALDAARPGWTLASVYYSDTAPLKSVKDYAQYYHSTIALAANRLQCESVMNSTDKPAR